jgi:hypothetical protein
MTSPLKKEESHRAFAVVIEVSRGRNCLKRKNYKVD